MIELVVAVGLMAIFMTMLATVFGQAGSAFTIARSSVEMHQNARAAFDIMLRDFASAQLCNYEGKVGYFAAGWVPDPENGTPVQSVTFTTLADQPGAQPLVPGVSPQVALVRYTLEAAGGTVTVTDPDTNQEREAPIYYLVKHVRFPQLAYRFVDMNFFPTNAQAREPAATSDIPFLMPYETRTTTDGRVEGITKDVVALGVLDMRVRVFYAGSYIEVLDHGLATDDSGSTTVLLRGAADKNWPALPANADVRVLAGYGAPAVQTRSSNTATSITVASGFPAALSKGRSSFRIEQRYPAEDPPYSLTDGPAWLDLPSLADDVPGTSQNYLDSMMYPMRIVEQVPHSGTNDMTVRMPYIVEITLWVADHQAKTKRTFRFTQRFFIESSTR